MIEVKEKRPNPYVKGLKLFGRRLRDRWLILSVIIVLLGLMLFELSSAWPMYELKRLDTASRSFIPSFTQNTTVYFSTPHGELGHLLFSIPQGELLSYSIYYYSYYQTQSGEHYYQREVMHGTVDATNESVYMPVLYTDSTYFVNLTLAKGAAGTVSLNAYAEFYTLQPVRYPLEIAGVLLLVAGIIGVAIRMTMLAP